jgi:rubredoxin
MCQAASGAADHWSQSSAAVPGHPCAWTLRPKRAQRQSSPIISVGRRFGSCPRAHSPAPGATSSRRLTLMFRCKVCGWIHDGIAPPDSCPSCGTPADRFRPMDSAEIGMATERARRLRDGRARGSTSRSTTPGGCGCWRSSTPRSTRPTPSGQGKRYPLAQRRRAVVLDNIPCMSACPVAHRHLPLHRADRGRRYADSYELNREHNVFPAAWAGCAPAPARRLAAARRSTLRSASAT